MSTAKKKNAGATTTQETFVNEDQASDNNSDGKKQKESEQFASIRDVFSFAKTTRVKVNIFLAVICSLFTGAVFPAMAFYFAKAFEDLAATPSGDEFLVNVTKVAYAFMVLGAVMLLGLSVQTMFMETAASEMTMAMKQAWFEALLRQDMAYYDLQDVSGQATILSLNGAKYRKGVGRKLASAVQYTISCLGSVVYAFWASWRVSLAVLATCPFMFMSMLFLVKMTTTQSARAAKSYAKAGAVVTSAVSNIRTILSLNAVETVIGLYQEATMESLQGAVSNYWLLGLANGIQYVGLLLSYVVVTLYGSWLLYNNVRLTGCDPSATVPDNDTCDPKAADVFGALMGISFAASVLPQVSVALEAFSGARAACYPAILAMSRRLETTSEGDGVTKGGEAASSSRRDPEWAAESKSLALYSEDLSGLPKYEIDSSSELGLCPKTVQGDIEFHSVSFSYPARAGATVLSNFDLKVPAGKTVALVGPSGGGKSTVLQLIDRFYDPTLGAVTLDGEDVRNLNVKWLRKQIGMVLQEPKLFGKSIRENISLGNPKITQAQIEAAAKQANAHDFIMSFPQGYDTEVGELGGQLSGGQKQRISIARILAKQPRLLLLDEATSALDSESEVAVQQALDHLMEVSNATTVVIAHRLSTIKNADIIAVVKNGRVVEQGSHNQLLPLKGDYYQLVQAQQTPSSTGNAAEKKEPSLLAQFDDSAAMGEDSELLYSGSILKDDPLLMSEAWGLSTVYDDSNPSVVVGYENVSFSYPARPDTTVLNNFNLQVHRGETLALVGPSGSGKSTTMHLLEAFYRPDAGRITYHGVDLKQVNTKWLRSQLGLVSQEASLFHNTTILDNIRFGNPSITQQEVVQAAKLAFCHDFIVDFPDGYDTMIGGDHSISGGQKQRIAIARMLCRQPQVYLLDEATSALDSQSERMVQAALDRIMASDVHTCIVIAHRLSTIRNATRIAYIEQGRVREIGTHDQLMAKPTGRYRRLQELQSLSATVDDLTSREKTIDEDGEEDDVEGEKDASVASEEDLDGTDGEDAVKKERDNKMTRRAWLMGFEDVRYILLGAIGAIFAGLFFPAWGITFAYMIEVLYQRVERCDEFPECSDYHFAASNYMQDLSMNIFYGYLGLGAATVFGNVVLFWGFGSASERMNKRIRDAAFTSIVKFEVGWFDLHAPAGISSRLADDAALLHAFAGEPVRTLLLNAASVLVGVVVAFVYMWPFALLTLAILPFLAFGAEMEMRTYTGEDDPEEDLANKLDETSPSGIVIETLSNMRTIASLTLEQERAQEYRLALHKEEPNPVKTSLEKGGAAGLGEFFQFWAFALMFFWGGWLLLKYPDAFSYRAYLISMFALFFSLYGLTVAAQGAVNREKAKEAAHRIFALTDRKSLIDPLSEEGLRDLDGAVGKVAPDDSNHSSGSFMMTVMA